ILQLPFLGSDGTVEVENSPRSITLHAKNGAKDLDLRIFVSAVRNLIVLSGEGHGLEKGDVAIRLYRHRDTILPGGELHPTVGGGKAPDDFEQLAMPRAGADEDTAWIAQDFPGEMTFPSGFTALLAARVAGASTAIASVEGQKGLGIPMVAPQEGRLDHATTKRFTPINESPGSASTITLSALSGPFAVFVCPSTTQDDADPLRHAMRELDQAASVGVEALWEEHTKQLDAYEARPHARAWKAGSPSIADVVWGGVPYRVRPSGYYGDVPLCSVASTKFCVQDSSNWHGDFHFNEVDATGPCMLRQFDQLDSYYRMILTLLPMAQANARDVYASPGAMYPLVHYPLKADSVVRTHLTWEQSMEITALLTRPFWLRFQYTWDKDFLRDLAYPVLREGARFYVSILKEETDGFYHVIPTVSPEHRGITKNFQFNRDSQSALTLIRYHLRAAAEAARILGVDSDEAATWADRANHLAPYPTYEGPQGTVYMDVAGGEPIEFNIPVPLSAVFWGDDIGLDSPPEVQELALRTLEQINVWVPHRGYLSRVRARLGIVGPDDNVGLEHLLQSHTGFIRVFPAVPPDFEGGFENLGAQGAFIVASERKGGAVSYVRLQSLAGNTCKLINPWPGKALSVTDTSNDAVQRVETSERYANLTTEAGHTYEIVAAD
ncbi:MAG: hypothetical protein IT364_13390, partial [Candidatus Hydrogenedentes bacterium]|nr:hypothetical protein [Candidatus Hydrogenedentota bacterium]